MRIGIIVVGIVLVIIGIILLSVGEIVISESQHYYSSIYQSGQDKELLLIGKLIMTSGTAGIIAGLITVIMGFFKTAKRTKIEKLQAKIKVKQLKDELKELKKEK